MSDPAESYQEAADRLSVGLPVPIDDPESRVWLRWSDKTLQRFPGQRTRREWDAIAQASIAASEHLPND